MTALAWGARVSPEFRDKARTIAARLGTEPSSLMACIAFETGRTFSPKARNPGSSATGLIGFMRDTARSLGTSVEALAEMTAEEQLAFVHDYLRPFTGRVSELGDLYMAILYPPAVGQPDDFAVFENATKAYQANAGLDFNHDGQITKRECVSIVEKLLAEGLQVGNRAFEPQPDVPVVELQPAAPIEDRPQPPAAVPAPEPQPAEQETAMPDESSSVDWSSALKLGGAIASFFNPLIGVAITSLGSVVESKIEKEMARHTDPATAKVVAGQLTTAIQDGLAKVTGKADPVAAVAEIRANPKAAAEVATVVEQKLVDMRPLLDDMHRQAQERYAAEAKDRNDAAVRVSKVGWNIQKWLVVGGMVITGMIVAALLALLIVQVAVSPNHLPDAALIAFAGPVLILAMQGLREAYAFAFGGTQEGSPAAIAKGARS